MIHSLWRYSQLYCQVYTLRNSNMAACAAFLTSIQLAVMEARRMAAGCDLTTV